MSDLLAHIKAENAKTQGWIDAGEDRWAGMIVEDLEHWDKFDIHTVEQYERYMMLGTIADLYKEVTGVRQSWSDTESMSMKELEAEYDNLVAELAEEQKREAESQAQAVAEFENTIANLIVSGAGDRETAIRWLREGEQDEQLLYDDDFFEYSNELPYGYLKQAEVA